jgi:hypothetical protein
LFPLIFLKLRRLLPSWSMSSLEPEATRNAENVWKQQETVMPEEML